MLGDSFVSPVQRRVRTESNGEALGRRKLCSRVIATACFEEQNGGLRGGVSEA
jgi:hypothetical protein